MPGGLALHEQELRSRFAAADFLRSCDQAFYLYGQGVLRNPPRSEEVARQGQEDHIRLDMTAEWPGRYRSRKTIEERSDVRTGRLASRRAVLLLEDLVRDVQVEMDAGYLTDMRTGAAGALGIGYLAEAPVRRVGIVGTGRIGQSLALAVDRLFELDELRVTSRNPDNRRAFARRLGRQLRAPLHMAADLVSCLEGMDGALLAVPTPEPILDMAAVSEGMLLAVMAGDRRTRQVAPEVLEQVGVLVDHLEQASKSGEFVHAEQTGRLAHVRLAREPSGRVLDIGDAACGRLEGSAPRPRLAYFTGMAAQDLCAAAFIYETMGI